VIIRQALQSYVRDHPGTQLREITDGLGITDRAGITNAGAQLYQLVKKALLRQQAVPGRQRGVRYYPTALTLTSQRLIYTAEEVAANAAARELRKQQRRKAKRRLTAAQQQAFYATAPTPPPAVRACVEALPPPPTAPRPAGKVETVEEFLARNGRIQVLDPHATSTPLRFDHSQGSPLNRPVRRTRVAVAP
jgi:hypothetical protein